MATCDLKSWLAKEGLSQEKFEQQTGIPQSVVSRIVNGADCSPETMRKVYNATAGEVTPNWLVLHAAG